MDRIKDAWKHITSRYNIAPSQPVPIIRVEAGAARILSASWGLVPSWAKDPKDGPRPINAMAETVTEKPTFRSVFKRRRCLVLASGYYEWKKLDAKHKQAIFIKLPKRPLFCFAGLWDRWEGSDRVLESCTILTTAANERLATIHQRMPVILDPEQYARWIDPQLQDPAEVMAMIRSYPAEAFDLIPVGPEVGKVSSEGPELIKPWQPPPPVAEPGPEQLGLFG